MTFALGSKTTTRKGSLLTMIKQRATGLDGTLRTVFETAMPPSPYWTLWIHNDGSNAFTNCDVFISPNLSDEAAAALNIAGASVGGMVQSSDPTTLAAGGVYEASNLGVISQVTVQIAAHNTNTTDANVWLFIYHPHGPIS